MNVKTMRMMTGSLSVLLNLSDTHIFQKYTLLLESYEKQPNDFCRAYTALCNTIYRYGDSGKLFYDELRFDRNILTDHASTGNIPDYILSACDRDISVVNKLISLNGSAFLELANKAFPDDRAFWNTMPVFPAGTPLPVSGGHDLLEMYRKEGYGFFARGTAFTISSGKPVLIEHPDPITLADLKGYVRQKKAIIDNTTAFLAGKNANNVLLYGDKGTGKSSTVKAVANQFAPEGLKIIEIPVRNISSFPMVCEAAKESPYKFIVFLDDLSFNKEDENFASLKAFIEGGITEKPDNLVIYATSNRRHLVREGFSDRDGDEIHLRDTLETVTSLSDRFGLEITFSNPAKDEYLYIIDKLAEEKQLFLPSDELHMLAERFALRKSGRSPRTARQFIMHQLAIHDAT